MSLLTISEVARRSGVTASALRFYEERGLIASHRTGAGHRRFPRAVLRRIAFIVYAQRIGLTLEEIGAELARLPESRVPTRRDWSRLMGRWQARIRTRTAELERLEAGLVQCVGCGCLSRPLSPGQSRRPSGAPRSGPALLDRRRFRRSMRLSSFVVCGESSLQTSSPTIRRVHHGCLAGRPAFRLAVAPQEPELHRGRGADPGPGIGANTTLFSVLHSVLLSPLLYPDSDRLAVIWNELGQGGAQSLPAVSAADYRDYRRMSERFEDFAAASGARAVGLSGIITGEGVPEKVDLSPVTANFLPLFGINPALGRHFAPEEEVFEGPKVAMVSHELWQRRYGGDPGLLGSLIEIDGQPHEVVAVLPRGFRLLLPAEAFLLKHSDVWTLLQYDYDNAPPRKYTTFSVFGKLEEGVTFAQAQEEMERIEADLRATHPVHAASNLQIRAVPLQQDVVKGVRPLLFALMGAVGFVLLIVCANVANLLLVRGAARGCELAIQAALGAGSGRLVRRLLVESGILAALGAALAVAISWAAFIALAALAPAELPRLGEISIDGTVLAFTAGIALLTALLFGLIPAFQGTRIDLAGCCARTGAPAAPDGTIVCGRSWWWARSGSPWCF